MPEPGGIVSDGALLCRGGRVVACGALRDCETGGVEVLDLGEALVLPGFVNAHTHLELTGMEGLLRGDRGFVPWMRSLRREWRGWSRERRLGSVRLGARRSLEAGVTCVGQIAAGISADAALGDTAPLRMRVFHEIVAPGWAPVGPMLAIARVRRALTGRRDGRLRFGLGPHAPYSVSARGLRACFRGAARRGEPVTIHAAETVEELDFCRDGTGALAEYLRRKHLLGRRWRAPGMSPIAWLAGLGLGESQPALVAHGNYATGEEIRWMARRGVSVAFCPPSHRFFGHAPYPLRAMIEAGVSVCIATDSLASSDTLDPLDALREVRGLMPGLSSAEWMATITTHPARAIGWDDAVGRLTAGRLADFVAFRLDGRPADPLESLLQGDGERMGVWLGGVNW